MNILVCVKRVPDIGSRIDLTEDGQRIKTQNLGFTISPHEECAVEAAIQLVEQWGGAGTVLTLGPSAAEEQLRDCLARGMDRGILLETDGSEWDPGETAEAITAAVQAQSDAARFDLLLFGNEAADSGDFQVPVRVAYGLGLPCLTGAKALEITEGKVAASREVESGWAIYELPLPAVIAVKEGINLPRYPSLRGTMKAKKKPVERIAPERVGPGLRMERLFHPPETGKQVKMLGQGTAAVPKVMEVLRSLEVIAP